MTSNETMTASGLTLDPNNANRGTERGRQLLRHSLQEFGAGRSILADKNDVIIAGNKTWERAEEIGLPVRIVETDGTELVVVKRVDLDLNSDPAARALAIADNRTAQLDLEWDAEVLQSHRMEGMNLQPFFSDDELSALLTPQSEVEMEVGDLDRIMPDAETTTPGRFLHFDRIKIPLTEEEANRLTLSLAAYREEAGTYYGFVGSVLFAGDTPHV
jgi:hypothetical protein